MVHLNVIGEGADLSAARALAEGSNQIRFLPFLDAAELEQILRSSRFFVTATLYEGFGLSVVEAMAAGRVVIANDIPVLRKLIDHGINGFLIDFSAPPDIIAQRLLDIVELPEDLLARIASRASDVASGYSWAHRREIISRIFWLGGESA
jgi:alpha-1,3-mannosyltransferase